MRRKRGKPRNYLVLCVPVGGYPDGMGPWPGSELRDCVECGGPVWISPGAMAAAVRSLAPLACMCARCALERKGVD